jgi:outer membrane biosynthesis protein TonB
MSVLRQPMPRFFLWAALLVAVAVGTAVAGLKWWLIALIELAAWAAVTLAERSLWQATQGSRDVARPARAPRARTPEAPKDEIEAVRIVEPEKPKPAKPASIPVPVAAASNASEPEPEPVVAAPAAPPPPAPRTAEPKPEPVRAAAVAQRTPDRWNVWYLERIAREHPEAEELEFITASLREFADADGQLPETFDSLVRESFGDLLPG